jgi:hypothetical protein
MAFLRPRYRSVPRLAKQLKNSSQNIPRASEELKKKSEQWVKLQVAFAPVFEWIRAMVISLRSTGPVFFLTNCS